MQSHFYFQILLVGLHIGLCRETTCGPGKYLIDKECCPMCAPGNHVLKRCDESTPTSCIPCTGSTYMAQPTGRTQCFECRTCDPVSGLKVKQSCISTSDAVCEPLEGHFCKLPAEFEGCKLAHKYSNCKPGQYISQQATSFKDTECSDCPGDTFSSGSSTSCQPHTKCESLDQVQVSPGTNSSDTSCETAKPGYTVKGIYIAAGILITGAISIPIPVAIMCWKLRKKKQQMNTVEEEMIENIQNQRRKTASQEDNDHNNEKAPNIAGSRNMDTSLNNALLGVHK